MTLKLKIIPRIPANLIEGDGIIITEVGNNITIAIDATPGVFQLADTDLQALADNSTNGFWARTGSGTGAARTLTGTANEITVANGDGSGAPTFSLPSSLTFTGKTVTGGTYTSVSTINNIQITAPATLAILALAASKVFTVNNTLTLAGTDGALIQFSADALFPSIAQGDLWYGSATGVISALAKSTSATRYLANTGTSNNPAWAQINLSNGVTGTLPVGNGGTGITSLGTGVATALAVNTGTDGAFVVKGGALGSPSSATLTSATGLPISTGVSGLGTGIATALAVNTGSAGAPVLFNGALGTPSSGTLTNCTGLPVGSGISGFGTGVATALAVNVGSAGAFVTLNGALGTPSSGTATNLTGLPLTTGVTGTLPVGNGGTGITAFGTGVATALGVNVGSAGAFVTFNGAGGTPSSLTLTNATGLPIGGGGTGATTAQSAMAALKGVYILAASAVQSTHTGDTVEFTLATITIPANAMGANGAVRVTVVKGSSGTAGNHTIKIKFGGTSYYDSGAQAAYVSGRHQVQVQNRNATNSQVGAATSQANFNLIGVAVVTSAIDTTASVNITITGQLSNSADTITVESYLVELIVP